MSLRQNVMIRWALAKKAFQLGRRLTEAEQKEVVAVAINETQILYGLVGAITITWAQIELNLDVINGVLIMQNEITETQLPLSLKPKIAFFEKAFPKIPKLAHLNQRAIAALTELNRLKVIRHDIIHGAALARTEPTTRKFIRVDYRGANLEFRYEDYDFARITRAMTDIIKLKDELFVLFRDMLFILAPDAAKQTYG